jgi:acyl-coenzyme A thioesterase PaaI-like protein
MKSIQETYAPESICFGCGPANAKGLRIRSFEQSDGEYIAEWRAEKHHEAFPGMLNGGIIGSLLDCHSNWAAAHYLMKKHKTDHAAVTVTANYSIRLLRPTPSDALIKLRAKIVDESDGKVTVEAELIANDKTCATCKGLFVEVSEGHPAYHRW